MSATLNPANIKNDRVSGDTPKLAGNTPVEPTTLSLADRFGITEESLEDRRAYVSLGDTDRALMLEFVEWSKAASSTIAKQLLDHHFEFAPTRAIFERRAKARSVSLDALRENIEKAQARQFEEAFAGAANNWNLEYFERRLFIGQVHAQFHLPFKWYLGAYPDLMRLTREQLRASGITEKRAALVVDSLGKVFNLDMQAIGDSYLLNTLELCGLDISAIISRKGSDRTEHLDQVQLAVSMLIKQADALADDRLRDTILERQIQVAGKLGDAFGRAHSRLIRLANQADALAKGDLQDDAVLSLQNVGRNAVLGNSMKRLYQAIRQVTDFAAEIGKGNLTVSLEGRSESDELVAALNQMLGTLRKLIADLNHMSSQHAVGDIDVRINTEEFSGAFGTVTEAINDMVTDHIATNQLALACVDEFGRGDFEAPLQAFPGKKQFINVIIESVRTNLQRLMADTSLLAQAAASRNLKTRADGDRHPGDYRKIIEAINSTLDMAVEPLRATAEAANTLASSAEQLTVTSRHLVSGAEQTAREASVVSESGTHITQSVTNMATSSEEMLASIREISRNANEAARVAKSAVTVATATNKTINQLGDSSTEIGKVVKVITSIAQQTNLLALNATIEAARAGEAGKGFAVVANEVKELAKETARATEEISRKIEAIQADTQSAVRAIGEVGVIIGTVNDISNSIASAVEEQTATTNEIGRNVHEAARETSDISRNISSVAQVATGTAKGAQETESAARTLTELAARMKDLVAGFHF